MTTPPKPEQPVNPSTGRPARQVSGSLLSRLDAWMAANPWHPRALPFFIYIIGLLVGQVVYAGYFGIPEMPALRPVVYVFQVGVVVFLLARYRRLLPELNFKFHWLAVPTGIGLLFAWVHLGYASNWLAHQFSDAAAAGDVWRRTDRSPINDHRGSLGDAWFWTTMSLRLLGMSLVVPLFEELWVRSAVLRGTFSAKHTKTALFQLASDLPVIGEPISKTRAGRDALGQPPMFTRQLEQTPVGKLSVFAVIASTFVFMLAHQPRDYMGCIACGIVWCWLVWFTNRPRKGESWDDQPAGGRIGLGPIVWSHGITNATLWAWTLYTNDWQFL